MEKGGEKIKHLRLQLQGPSKSPKNLSREIKVAAFLVFWESLMLKDLACLVTVLLVLGVGSKGRMNIERATSGE